MSMDSLYNAGNIMHEPWRAVNDCLNNNAQLVMQRGDVWSEMEVIYGHGKVIPGNSTRDYLVNIGNRIR